MISDEDVEQLFKICYNDLAKHGKYNGPSPTQFFRGTGRHIWKKQPPGGCSRHIEVFNKLNIIPKYCFDCYKVVIEPRTVIELFKLMMVLEKIKLPKDNIRKCIVEGRPQASGTYKGLIYCKGIEEGNDMLKTFQEVISEEISKNIPVTLKRGCTEYTSTYPEYARVENGTVSMEYKEEWQELEDLADKQMVINKPSPASFSYNHPTYTPIESLTMLSWLTYAASIGDTSYLNISGFTIQPIQGLTRPTAFCPPDD